MGGTIIFPWERLRPLSVDHLLHDEDDVVDDEDGVADVADDEDDDVSNFLSQTF